MAVKESSEESNPDEDEVIDINDPPIHVNNPHEPTGELALINLGVYLRSRPSITRVIHLESGAHDPFLLAEPPISINAQASNSKSLPKKNTHPSDGNNAEMLQQDKELHAKKPFLDPVNDNQKRVNGSAEIYHYSRETSADQELAAASGYTHREQTRATPASDQQLCFVNSSRSQAPISQAQRHTSSSVSLETSPPPTPQNGSLHPNINSQIPHVTLSIPAINLASQQDHQTTTPLVRDLNLQDLGIIYERPKKPEFAILAKRIESFQGWPVDSPVTKEDVAKSGLYYEGYEDCGRCFFCGGILSEWKRGNDPFIEHAHRYPKCGYIRQYKGQAFVEIVQMIKTHSPNMTQITSAMVVEEMNRRGLKESNAFDEDPVEHDAAVTSLLEEITSPNSTLRYTRKEVIHAAQILRRQKITLSSDLILSQLTQNHDATDSRAQGATASSGASNAGTIEDLKDQNSILRNKVICKICMGKEVKIVFLPCGHLVSCQECAVAFHVCPICHSHIRAYVRANIRSL